jgi:hypothetical protein
LPNMVAEAADTVAEVAEVAEAAEAAEAADTDAEAAEAAEAAGVAEAGVFRSEVSASAVPDLFLARPGASPPTSPTGQSGAGQAVSRLSPNCRFQAVKSMCSGTPRSHVTGESP